jgi:hypothetical protein
VNSIDKPLTPRHGSLFVIFLTVFIDLLGFGIVLASSLPRGTDLRPRRPVG